MEYPGFSTVECLELNIEFRTTELMLQNCVNVKKLNIVLNEIEERCILGRNRLENLEELYWLPKVCISQKLANKLINNCSKLRIAKGLYVMADSQNYRGVKFTE